MKKKYSKKNNLHATLYIVPTPIGNLEDITKRALSVLMKVNFIACEDVYHTKNLLKHFSIKGFFLLFNNANESWKEKKILEMLKKGKNIALVSKAGTPLISDPGYKLVKRCYEEDITVVALPGPCAAITALVGSGLPTDNFLYQGFLPLKKNMRCKKLRELKYQPYTLIFYESKHRISESMQDISDIFGSYRYVVLARELTKYYESIHGGKIFELIKWIQEDTKRLKGEMVLVIEGYNKKDDVFENLSPEILRMVSLLKNELPIKKIAKIISELYGLKKNFLYKKLSELFVK